MKNSKFRNENGKFCSGFTLVELLAVMVVLVVVGAIIVQILYSTIRGSGKTNLITLIRQNGNFTISQMVKIIRDAKSFDGVGKVSDGVDVANCVNSVVGALTPTPTPVLYDYVKVTTTNGGKTVFICCPAGAGNNPPATIASNSGALIDCSALGRTSLLDTTAVVLGSCSFSCSQQNFTDHPTIGIEFSLLQKGGGNLPESTINPIYFNTSVSMRNLSR
ncbi:MAG: prepilin-type N-terminal cleavage/methylation domain-containing protein [Patescibacteria group bacterium]|nr:prepilin-type N-terminal cleavage/methylation domain-containing protein [Patescibacteria group bacterium]